MLTTNERGSNSNHSNTFIKMQVMRIQGSQSTVVESIDENTLNFKR